MKPTPVKPNIEDLPRELEGLFRGAAVYDSSCSASAEVLFIDKDEGYYLKTAKTGALMTEKLMTEYFHSLGLSAETLYYGTENGRDFLLTRRVPGEDCTDARYLSEPERLCDATASLLRRLHETDGSACPVNRTRTYAEYVKIGVEAERFEPELFRGLWEFGSFEEAKKAAEEGLLLLKTDVLLHGDYCLPNVILDDWRFSGFVDLGCGGMGDRHIDVLWGIWTLCYNLKTARYTERFIDAYGRDAIEPDMLRMTAAMEIIGG